MGAMPDRPAVEWRPGPAEVRVWSVVALFVTLAGLPLFGLPTLIQHGGSGSIRIGLIEVLVIIALTALLVVTHEAIHGLVMRRSTDIWGGARRSRSARVVRHIRWAPIHSTAIFRRGRESRAADLGDWVLALLRGLDRLSTRSIGRAPGRLRR